MDISQKRKHKKPTFIWQDTQSPQFKKHPLRKIRILSNLSHFNLPLGWEKKSLEKQNANRHCPIFQKKQPKWKESRIFTDVFCVFSDFEDFCCLTYCWHSTVVNWLIHCARFSVSLTSISFRLRTPRDKSTYLWTPYLWQRRQEYTMEKRQSL